MNAVQASEELLATEVHSLAAAIARGDPQASLILARLIEADRHGTLQPFTRALAARLRDYLWHWAEMGVTDPEVTVGGDVYHLVRQTSELLLRREPARRESKRV